MLTRRIIPCLDVKNGRVVKGVRFDNLRDCGDPVELSLRYEEEGADEIVILDVSATNEARLAHLKTIAAVRKQLSLPLTTGGGVSCAEDVRRLLDVGADKVSINSAAVKTPQLLCELSARYGSQCTVLAVDAVCSNDGWKVVIRSAQERTEKNAIEWAKEGAALGAGEILLTSWDRDGTGEGYDVELISAVSTNVSVPVIASGGAKEPSDFLAALQSGADAVLAATIFHEKKYSVEQLKTFLLSHGVEVRR